MELDFGHDSKISAVLGERVTMNYWNNLTIFHNISLVYIILNDEVKLFQVPGENYNLIIDPEIYIGGGPELQKKMGLQSYNNFAGNLYYLYYYIYFIYFLFRININYDDLLLENFYPLILTIS